MKLTNWTFTVTQGGPCQYTHDEATKSFIIQTANPATRARWSGYLDHRLDFETDFILKGQTNTPGLQHIYFLNDAGNIIDSFAIELGQRFTALPFTTIRIDLMMGKDSNRPHGLLWTNIELIPAEEPPPAEETVNLPIPPVAEMQAHRVSGYKWGRNFFLVDHSEIPVPNPPDAAHIITGHQIGRDLELKIGWPHIDEDEEE